MTWKWALAQRLEIWWWQRYLKQKTPDEYLTWKAQYWQALINQLPATIWPKRGDTILEAGCGPAGLFTILDDFRVTAFDPLLDHYQEKLSHFDRDLWPKVDFHCSTMEAWTTSTTYPLVCSFNAINHVSNWQLSMQNLWQTVAPGGWLVLSSDVHRYRLTKNIFQLIPGDMLHPQQHTQQDYLETLKGMGGTIVWDKVYRPGKVFNYWIVVVQKSPA